MPAWSEEREQIRYVQFCYHANLTLKNISFDLIPTCQTSDLPRTCLRYSNFTLTASSREHRAEPRQIPTTETKLFHKIDMQ